MRVPAWITRLGVAGVPSVRSVIRASKASGWPPSPKALSQIDLVLRVRADSCSDFLLHQIWELVERIQRSRGWLFELRLTFFVSCLQLHSIGCVPVDRLRW